MSAVAGTAVVAGVACALFLLERTSHDALQQRQTIARIESLGGSVLIRRPEWATWLRGGSDGIITFGSFTKRVDWYVTSLDKLRSFDRAVSVDLHGNLLIVDRVDLKSLANVRELWTGSGISDRDLARLRARFPTLEVRSSVFEDR